VIGGGLAGTEAAWQVARSNSLPCPKIVMKYIKRRRTVFFYSTV
jgi:folate-dependent tRNA-U54 methylase TrmFO/GidA